MHLLTPLIAIAEIIFLSDVTYTRKDNRLVMLSPLIYGAFYLGNNVINGIGEWPDTNDEYSALGIPVILDRIPQISKSVPLAVSIGTYRCSI